jgi:hypothetical protein
MYNCNIEARSSNHCCGKSICVIHSESVSVALVIQHATRMRCIILLSVACLAVPYSSALIHKQHDFGEKNIESKIYVEILFTTLSEIVLILTRIQRHIVTNVHRCLSKVPVILVRF